MPDPIDPDFSGISEESPSRDKAAFEAEVKAFGEAITLSQKQEELESVIQDRAERKKYAARIFRLMLGWVIGVFAILLFQGFLSTPRDYALAKTMILNQVSFKLSDGVLIAVVSGTTASVIGIFLVVANYLFPKR